MKDKKERKQLFSDVYNRIIIDENLFTPLSPIVYHEYVIRRLIKDGVIYYHANDVLKFCLGRPRDEQHSPQTSYFHSFTDFEIRSYIVRLGSPRRTKKFPVYIRYEGISTGLAVHVKRPEFTKRILELCEALPQYPIESVTSENYVSHWKNAKIKDNVPEIVNTQAELVERLNARDKESRMLKAQVDEMEDVKAKYQALMTDYQKLQTAFQIIKIENKSLKEKLQVFIIQTGSLEDQDSDEDPSTLVIANPDANLDF